MRVIEGKLDGSGLKLGLVISRFNEAIVSRLESGALDCLLRHGVASDDLTLVRVPGAWEIPVATARLAAAGGCDAIICLGVLIRGGTAHFDLIAAEVAKGVAQVAMASAIPVTFGVVTAESIEQALERAGTKLGNKGWEAALAAIEMARVTAELPPAPRPRGR